MKLSPFKFSKRTTFVFVVLTLIFLANTFSSYHNIEQILLSQKEVAHSRQILLQIEQLRNSIQKAETAERGFLITNNHLFLESFLDGSQQVTADVKSLQYLTQSYPKQQQRLQFLSEEITQRIAFFQKVIDSFNQNGFTVARNMIVNNPSWSDNEIIDSNLTEMSQMEQQLLAERELNYSASVKSALFTFAGASAGNAILLITGYLLLQRNLEKNKHLQKAADEKDKLDRTISDILESVTDGFFAVDKEWRFTYLNAEAEKFTRTAKENLIGKNMWEAFPQMKKSIYEEKYFEAVKTNQSLSFQKKLDKQQLWYEFHVFPSTQGLSVYFSDITEAKELEQRKDEFISIASHELKTPLTTIKSYAQLLEKHFAQNNDQLSLSYLQKMDAYLKKLMGLIGDLLDVSKIQAGKITLNIESFAFDQMIAELVADIQPTSKTHQITLRGKSNVQIKGDRIRLEQVFSNILTNAIKYSPDAKKVILDISTKKNRVCVSVQDFGVGIPPDKQARVFEKFYRVNEISKGFSGLGIGLFLSAEIVEKHQGKIWLESTLGKGTTVFVELPIK